MKIEVGCEVACEGFERLGELHQALQKARNVVLVAHAHADGDAVGSMVGCYAVLRRRIEAQFTLVLPDGCPDDLRWLPHTSLILHGKEQAERCEQALVDADLILGTDFNGADRLDNLGPTLLRSKAFKALIDHHHSPHTEQFDLVCSMPDISSASELCYWVLRSLYGCEAFDADAATAFYTGLRTDTGGMAYSNRQASLYLAAAELIGYGIDPMAINQQITNVFTPQRMKFYAFALGQRLEVDEAHHCALMTLAASDMAAYGVRSEDLTGLVNEVMKLSSVECAVLVREEADGRVRLSLRSKTTTDVNQMAAALYGGGGHTRAAGATSTEPMAQTVARVRKTLGMQ